MYAYNAVEQHTREEVQFTSNESRTSPVLDFPESWL